MSVSYPREKERKHASRLPVRLAPGVLVAEVVWDLWGGSGCSPYIIRGVAHRLRRSFTPHPFALTREFMNFSNHGHAITPAIGPSSSDCSRRISSLFLAMAVLQHRTWAAPERRLLPLQPARSLSTDMLLEGMLHRS